MAARSASRRPGRFSLHGGLTALWMPVILEDMTQSLGAAVLVLALAGSSFAQFVVDNAKIPATGGTTENLDFGDIDLDGDWDVVLAEGGDDGNDQNEVWVNQGGLQGGVEGFFTDATAARAPSVLDDSRDVEFVDFDSDGDLDVYVANTAQGNPQGNRWWTNLGGKQPGTLGFYADETAARWVGLGGPGSSIAVSQVLPGNTFIDWSCDCDFGDLDNDGDLDLIHASYGSAFAGQVPTRLFLNDGDGHFAEFNPSGFKLIAATIANGNPGLWCDGLQQANTTNTTGAFCDIASTALDVDVGDIDGDFDLDLLHGAREELPRMFVNRLNASSLAPAAGGGALAFRDLTGGVFPAGYATGSGHYEQELGDLDLDGDLDLLGINWQSTTFSFNDITLRNNGSGVFSNLTLLPSSSSDDNEGDFLDYDNDGDLDVYCANFSGADRLYRNDHTAPGTFPYTLVSLPSVGKISLDADTCDTDGDGDYDVMAAEDNFADETLYRNVTEVPDTHAPYLPKIETLGNQTAAAAGDAVRVHVYDNADYYITWYNDTFLRASVNGINLPALPARSSQGQVFRGVLPGNAVGAVAYRFTSSDDYGNTGSSATVNYTGSYGPTFAIPYGSGTSGLAGGEPALAALSVPFAQSKLYLAVSSAAATGTPVVLGLGTAKIPGGLVLPGLMLLNISGIPILTATAVLDAQGDAVIGVPVPTVPPGVHVFAQGFVFDPTAGGQALASSKGLELVTQ
jgi:hypothetical protein